MSKLLQPGRLLKQDLHNIRRRYVSDWTVFNQLILASAVYMFFTNLLPGITFASDLYVLTGQTWGTIEVVLSTGICGLVFALFSVQPLTILGVTGPFSVLAEVIYSLCTDSFRIDFLSFMSWTLIHAGWMHLLLALFNAHDWTMRYVTNFTTEIFSLLNTIIYIHKAVQELQRAHQDLSFAAFLYAIIGATGTFLVAVFLSTAERWRPLFHKYIRLGLSEYAAALSIIIFIGLPHVGQLASLDRQTLHVSQHAFKPTSPTRQTFLVHFWRLPAKWILAALIPGAIITILFFFDHEVSSIICTLDRYRTQKPGGFAWDIVLLGSTTALCGILGIPPSNGLLPQAPLHSESLMHSTSAQDDIKSKDPWGSRKPKIHPLTNTSIPPEKLCSIQQTDENCYEHKQVHEQRWSAFIHAAAIMAFIAPPLQLVLGLTPTSVLAGLFLFMGEQSLAVNPILYRFFQMLTSPADLPPLPSAVVHNPLVYSGQNLHGPDEAYTRKSKHRGYWSSGIHAYTILQIIIAAIIFVVTLTKGAPVFPIIVIACIPLRLLLVKRMWPRETLRFVDGWACHSGTPEDDEDHKHGAMSCDGPP